MGRLIPPHLRELERIDNMIFLISPEGTGGKPKVSMLGLVGPDNPALLWMRSNEQRCFYSVEVIHQFHLYFHSSKLTYMCKVYMFTEFRSNSFILRNTFKIRIFKHLRF